MKKEELFELLGKVDERFIDEAILGDEFDETRPVEVRPGKTRIKPFKIIAPIAACLAVAVGAGLVVSKGIKPKTEPETSSVEDMSSPGSSVIIDFDPEPLESAFIDECINIVSGESDIIAKNYTTWYVQKKFAFCDNPGSSYYDYLIIPQVDGHLVPDVGVRVFHKLKGYSSWYGETYDIRDHGGFAKDYADLNVDDLFSVDNSPWTYYYCYETNDAVTKESIRIILHHGDTEEFEEFPIMQKITDDSGTKYTESYEYDKTPREIGEGEFVFKWNRYAFVPKFYKEFTREEVDECREMLIENHNIPASWKERWRDTEIDLNLDGKNEILLSPQDCDYLKGVYVFARTENGIEEVACFDTEYGCCEPEGIAFYNKSANEFYPYYISGRTIRSLDGRVEAGYHAVNKIVVDEIGNVSTEEILVMGSEIIDEETSETANIYRINGADVTYDELWDEWRKYESDSDTYHVVTLPINENNTWQSRIVGTNANNDDPTAEDSFTADDVAACENDALTRNGKLELEEMLTPGMWHTGVYDINNDGEDELLVSLYNFSNMKGVFVYDKDLKFIGSFETEKGLCDPELIELYDKDGERYWYYLGIEGSEIHTGERSASRTDRGSINKIIFENGSFSTERLMHYDIIWESPDNTNHHYVYYIADKEVSEAEFKQAEHQHSAQCAASHDFDLTDPDVMKYSHMFEDSVITGVNKGLSD